MEYFIRYKAALAKNIKSIRLEKGLSVDDVAYVLNMSKANYYKIESGEQNVKGEWIAPLASLFRVGIQELFNGRTSRVETVLENQIKDYLQMGSEEELRKWLAIIGMSYRKKLTTRQYQVLIELISAMNEKTFTNE